MRIESGPTTERKVRSTLMLIMFSAFSAWFAYDGVYGYPRQNHEEFLKQIPAEERDKARMGPVYESVRFTESRGHDATADRVQKALLSSSVGDRKKALFELFGGKPSYENADSIHYFGPAYRVVVPLAGGVPTTDPVAGRGQRKDTDILTQKILGGGLALFSTYLIWFVISVRRTRAVLDESGLAFNGIGPIGWDDMKSLDITRFARKGTVDLHYNDHGAERSLRLDEYYLAAFDDIIDAICARKGFENPLPVKDPPSEPVPQQTGES